MSLFLVDPTEFSLPVNGMTNSVLLMSWHLALKKFDKPCNYKVQKLFALKESL